MRTMPRVLALLVAAGCGGLPEGRFDGLGPATRPISTKNPEAQVWFDQGLAFIHAFNHDEAIRSFEKAAELDPSCTMAWWGVALANGPHINNPAVDEAHAKAAWAALTKARAALSGASPVERALVEALGRRYADPQPADRAPLDLAYADAMRGVWKAYPKDADVGAWFAEAMMDLRPWDFWTHEGKPQPGTEEFVQTLERVLEIAPNHALAIHLYIHAVEASPAPGRADAPADRLRDLAPGLGHLVHMPSHIDIRGGRWDAAILANEKAIQADDAYLKRAKPPGFYRIYMAHNRHMLAFAAMMTGRSALTTEKIREMGEQIPKEILEALAPIIDGFLASPYEVHVRFGRWDAMLKEPEPAELFPLSRALWRFCRAVSLGALGRKDEARAEQKRFLEARAKVSKEQTFGNNNALDILAIAERTLEGELLFHEGRAAEAVGALTEGVKLEDALRYDEPPAWIQPVRHSLGAALLKSGRPADAEAVYRADLKRWPENGWSLLGLSRALRAQKKDAADVEARFKKIWKSADVDPTSSCLCIPGEK